MAISIGDLFWILLILAFLIPAFQQRLLDARRFALIRKIEENRRSRVIAMIHRQEVIAFLGIPFTRYIDIEDSESILRAIRMTPNTVPIDMIIHTPGGLVLAAEQIAKALVRHKAPVTIFVPHYAMSGGTLIALAADHIAMDENAVLGPLDPILGEYPVTSVIEVAKQKPIKEVEDKTLIYADLGKKAVVQVCRAIVEILRLNQMPQDKATKIANLLTSGQWTHDYPIEYDEAKSIGLPVSTEVPQEIYELMDLYPQAAARTPSVEYIPIPYRSAPSPSEDDQ